MNTSSFLFIMWYVDSFLKKKQILSSVDTIHVFFVYKLAYSARKLIFQSFISCLSFSAERMILQGLCLKICKKLVWTSVSASAIITGTLCQIKLDYSALQLPVQKPAWTSINYYPTWNGKRIKMWMTFFF